MGIQRRLIHNGERIFRARFPVLARVHILDAVQNIRVRRIINAFVGNEAHEFAAEFHPQCKSRGQNTVHGNEQHAQRGRRQQIRQTAQEQVLVRQNAAEEIGKSFARRRAAGLPFFTHYLADVAQPAAHLPPGGAQILPYSGKKRPQNIGAQRQHPAHAVPERQYGGACAAAEVQQKIFRMKADIIKQAADQMQESAHGYLVVRDIPAPAFPCSHTPPPFRVSVGICQPRKARCRNRQMSGSICIPGTGAPVRAGVRTLLLYTILPTMQV